ncbi:hypothetical protein LBMAG53_38720 [Planctomycetota bacterium]|nr:hypothetical protein LBMAG53_38720 [Planctomycetota bacterium]
MATLLTHISAPGLTVLARLVVLLCLGLSSATSADEDPWVIALRADLLAAIKPVAEKYSAVVEDQSGLIKISKQLRSYSVHNFGLNGVAPNVSQRIGPDLAGFRVTVIPLEPVAQGAVRRHGMLSLAGLGEGNGLTQLGNYWYTYYLGFDVERDGQRHQVHLTVEYGTSAGIIAVCEDLFFAIRTRIGNERILPLIYR